MNLKKIETGDLSQILHLRYMPKRQRFRNCSEPPVFDYFDWVIWSPDDKVFQRKRTEYPNNILMLAARQSCEVLLARIEQIRGATLVVGGEDTHLSTLLDSMNILAKHCKAIFYEAKDIRHERIRSFSMGFISYYMKRFDSFLAAQLIMEAKALELNKHGVLAAWGVIWKHLDEIVEDRRNASTFIEKTPWINRVILTPDLYMKRLMESKYLIAPAGNGIQAPKLAEAWLVRTVPIVVCNPCFEDLRDEGFPFLMLKSWEDLTETLVEQYEDERLRIDWESVAQMLTLKYFLKKI